MALPVDVTEMVSFLSSAASEEEWAVYNDADFLEPRFASGEIHPTLRELLLDTPLYTSPIPGPAKRYMLWTNEGRAKNGSFLREGWAVLRMRTITRSVFRTVTADELEVIEDGRRANG